MKIKYNKETKQWDELPEGSKEGIYIAPLMFQKLMNVQMIRKKGWDAIILIDGARRGGKSTLGMTFGTILDPETFCVENIASGMKDATRKMRDLPDGSILLIDEGSLVFNSKEAMKKESVQLGKIVDVCGQKNMVLIVCLPSYFDLNKSIAVTHSRFLIHVYTDNKLNRGFFSYYGERAKRKLYVVGKKNFGSYASPRPDFTDRFTDFKPSWYEDYLKVKKASMLEALQLETKGEPTNSQYLTMLLAKFRKNAPEVTVKSLTKAVGISKQEIYRRLKAHRESQGA